MADTPDPLFGGTIARGRFSVGKRVRTSANAARYWGESTDMAKRRVWITICTKPASPIDSLPDDSIAGVTPILYAGDLASDGGVTGTCVVEAVPAGKTSMELLWPLAQDHVRGLVIGIATIAQKLIDAGHTRLTLQPATVHALFTGTGSQVTALAPRTEALVGSDDILDLFDNTYSAPEVLAGEPMTRSSLLFTLGCLAHHWLCDEHAFEGDNARQQAEAIGAGRRTEWDGPRSWRRIIDTAVATEPAERNDLAEWIPWVRGQ